MVVYNESTDEFVAPTPGREEQQLLTTIHSWSAAAIAEVEDKRATLLDPLEQDKRQIRKEARAAFGQLIQANALITAHLNSIRQVHDLQSSALQELGVKDVLSSLNNRLIEISNRAVNGLEEIRKADGFVDKAVEIRSRIQKDN